MKAQKKTVHRRVKKAPVNPEPMSWFEHEQKRLECDHTPPPGFYK